MRLLGCLGHIWLLVHTLLHFLFKTKNKRTSSLKVETAPLVCELDKNSPWDRAAHITVCGSLLQTSRNGRARYTHVTSPRRTPEITQRCVSTVIESEFKHRRSHEDVKIKLTPADLDIRGRRPAPGETQLHGTGTRTGLKPSSPGRTRTPRASPATSVGHLRRKWHDLTQTLPGHLKKKREQILYSFYKARKPGRQTVRHHRKGKLEGTRSR